MALPDDSASTTPVLADYEPPYDRFKSPLEDFEAGGIALNDGTQGLEVQVWHLIYDDDEDSPTYGDFRVTGELTGESAVVINVPDVVRVGLAFNQNADPFIAYETNACEAKFYWYDTFIADYTTTTLPAGSKHVACCLDDHRALQTGTSDIIIAYIRGGSLYYRQERDRFEVERELSDTVGAGSLHRVGMSKNLRLKFDVREGSGLHLSELVGELCERVNMPANRFDTSALYPITYRGWRSAGMYLAADSIEALRPLYFFDFPQINGVLTAVRRGGDTVDTLPMADFVLDREVKFEDARAQGVEFPLKLNLMYSAGETGYTSIKAPSERRSRDIRSQSEDSYESAMNHTAQDAAERVDIRHKELWTAFELHGRFSIPESYAHLVPSDPVEVEVREGIYKRMRLTRMTRVAGAFDCEVLRDRQSAYTAGSIGLPVPVAPEAPPLTIPGDTTWEFMDLPALITAHDTLHYYVTGRGDADTAWHGFQVQREVGSDWVKQLDVAYAELMGEVEEALPAASPYFIDTTHTLLVSLNRAPTSVTMDLMLAGKGAWLVGDEILQVQTWSADGANWRGSVLLRGRLDTTPATHGIGTRAVFLGNPARVPVDGALLDTDLNLRAPSFGQAGSDAADANYTFSGRSQEEWPPEMLIASQDGNDWVLTWIPRHRLGNSANPIPSTHFYGWRLTFTVGMTSVVHDVASTDPAYTWTEAQQITDFGSAQATFDLDIQGLSYLGGPGKALSETVS